MMIDEGYRFAMCELRTMDNDLLTKGKIIKIGSDFLEISNDLGVESLVRYEKNIKVVINHSYNEPLIVEGRLYIPTMEFFRVIDMKTLAQKEQRNFFRVNVHLNAFAGVGPRGGGPSKRYNVVIQDLSLSGAFIRAKTILSLKTKVELTFSIDGKELILDGTVVRTKAIEEGYYGYGIHFVSVEDQWANAICQYLFKRQKEVFEIK